MGSAGDFVRSDYTTIHAEDATRKVAELLGKDYFVVVMEGGNYSGILTAADLTESPHCLAIDCIHSIPSVCRTESVPHILSTMRETKRLVLPVMEDGVFLGVVTYCDLLDSLLHQKECLSSQVFVRNLRLKEARESLMSSRAREKTMLTESQLKGAALDGALNAVLIADTEGRITYANPSFRSLWKLESDEIAVGRKVISFWHSPEKAQDVFVRVLANHPMRGELIGLRLDGTTFVAQYSSSAIFEGDTLIGVMGSFQDVTEKKAHESALQKSEERYRLLAESSLQAVGVHVDGIVVFANPAMCKLCGVSSTSDILGKKTLSLIAKRDRKRIEDGLHHIIETGETVGPLPIAMPQPDGREKLVEVSGVRIDYEGQKAVLAFGQDISESHRLKKALQCSEAKYRLLVENAPLGIAVIVEERFVFSNHAYAELQGESPESILKKHWESYIAPQSQPIIKSAYETILNEGEIPAHMNVMNRRVDGSTGHLRTTGARITFEGKAAILVLAQDITELAVAEEAKRVHEVATRQAEKLISLGTLVAGVAHEINNPNGIIKADVQNLSCMIDAILPFLSLKENDFDSRCGSIPLRDFQELLPDIPKSIERASIRIDSVVKHLLAFASETALVKEPVDACLVLQNACDLAKKYRSYQKHSIHFDKPDAPILVMGNSNAFEQIFLNLILNGYQSLSLPGQSVKISVLQNQESGQCIVEVVDTGCGISPKNLQHIYDPFFSTRKKEGGTGLGLSIVYGLVKEYNGTIRVDSTLGKGTTFTVELPLRKGT